MATEKETPVVYTTVQIPQELAQRLKVVAAVRCVSTKELVTKVLAVYVADELEKLLPGLTAKPVAPPVAAE